MHPYPSQARRIECGSRRVTVGPLRLRARGLNSRAGL